MKTRRIGFIIGTQLQEIRILSADKITGGGLGLMRFGWIADHVNASPDLGMHYELYRPWRSYDALIFMKAMDEKSRKLLKRYQAKGRPVIFDANVNFYEEFGDYAFEGMKTGSALREQAEFMTRNADAVIADSPYLREVCGRYHSKVSWIPDNVDMRQVPDFQPTPHGRGPLRILWSGQAHKLFEFLAIEDVLRTYKSHIELVLVTNSLKLVERCHPEVRERLNRLLSDVPHRVIPFESIPQLWSVYKQGGICMAPRFLNNAYNMGHTEWKITLAMACGRMAVCSPLSSYAAVQERSGGEGIFLCDDHESWAGVLDQLLSGAVDWECGEAAARRVVETYYDTALLAREHAAWVAKLWS